MDDAKALRRSMRAVERTPAGHRLRTRRINNLGAAWRERIAASGDITELDEAISYFRAARTGAGTALAATEHILAVLLSDRYDTLGEITDLTAAADAAQRALDAVPAGSGDRPGYLAMLAVCRWDWYDATGSLADLDRALVTAEEAVSGLAPDSPLWPRLHSNLGMLHLVRYERMGAVDDLDRAIELVGVGVETVRAGDSERPGFYANLASALMVRFERQIGRRGDPLPQGTIDLDDLHAAISLYGLALSEPDHGLVDRALILSNMGDALLDRAAMHRLIDEDEEAEAVYSHALAAHREAVEVTPRTAPDRAGRLNKLAVVQRSRAERTAAREDADAARATFREACETGLAAAPEMALAAAVNWVTWEVSRSAWPEVVAGDGYALRAAEALHRSQQLRAHRETWLLVSRGLAAEGAYAAVQSGDLRGAVVRMERGRAILLADDLDVVPTALGRLPDDDLARRYTAAARRLEGIAS
jgi:hypothetical protein